MKSLLLKPMKRDDILRRLSEIEDEFARPSQDGREWEQRRTVLLREENSLRNKLRGA